MLSKFLPPDFNPNLPIGIIAGKGRYPELLVEEIRKHNLDLKLLAFHDETDESLWNTFNASDRRIQHVGQIGKLLKHIKELNLGYALMAGQITPKRLFKGLNPDLKAVYLLAKLKEKNAESIFSSLANEIEKQGTKLLDARSFLDNHIANYGLMTKGKLKIKHDTINHGIKIAKEIAKLDIGQGVVVNNGTVLAVEAFEGTNEMLKRAATFNAKLPLFIKTVKVNQDYRFDVPVFGMHTITIMKENSLHHAGLEANSTIILDKEKVIQEANNANISLFGY